MSIFRFCVLFLLLAPDGRLELKLLSFYFDGEKCARCVKFSTKTTKTEFDLKNIITEKKSKHEARIAQMVTCDGRKFIPLERIFFNENKEQRSHLRVDSNAHEPTLEARENTRNSILTHGSRPISQLNKRKWSSHAGRQGKAAYSSFETSAMYKSAPVNGAACCNGQNGEHEWIEWTTVGRSELAILVLKK